MILYLNIYQSLVFQVTLRFFNDNIVGYQILVLGHRGKHSLIHKATLSLAEHNKPSHLNHWVVGMLLPLTLIVPVLLWWSVQNSVLSRLSWRSCLMKHSLHFGQVPRDILCFEREKHQRHETGLVYIYTYHNWNSLLQIMMQCIPDKFVFNAVKCFLYMQEGSAGWMFLMVYFHEQSYSVYCVSSFTDLNKLALLQDVAVLKKCA